MSASVLNTVPEAPPTSYNLTSVLQLMEELVNAVAEESRAKTTRYHQEQHLYHQMVGFPRLRCLKCVKPSCRRRKQTPGMFRSTLLILD